MPEVIEVYRMPGDVDYLMRVVVPDMQTYDLFYKRLIAVAPLKNVTSRFAMERVKSTTALPILRATPLPADAARAGSGLAAQAEIAAQPPGQESSLDSTPTSRPVSRRPVL